MDILTKNDPATMQTAAGFPDIKTMGSAYTFSTAEITRLRELALRVAEIAALPVQSEKAKLWTLHNDLKSDVPMVFIDPENGWNECIEAKTLVCFDPLARVWEMHLLKQIYWFEVMKDDKTIEPYFDVPYVYSDTGWGVSLCKEGGENGGAYKLKQSVEDYVRDFPKLHYPELIIDYEASECVLTLAKELFDGILIVRRKSTWWWTLGMTWDYINLRGLEDFMCDLLVDPDWVHQMMELLCSGILKRLDFLEENNLLSQNTGGTYVGSGGFGFTDEIVPKTDRITTMDMWGFVESQETTAVSPDLYGEFIFPYHKRIAERFALNCYGCCEPFDPRWKYIKDLPRLRRVSCSPWVTLDAIEPLLQKNYIASAKPNPTPLASNVMDEEAARKDIKKILAATKGCITEIIMKDNNTLGMNPQNASRWVEIARQEIDYFYGV